jgi:hypothetical protein
MADRNALTLPPYQLPGSQPLPASTPPTNNFLAAMRAMNLTPQEQALYLRHLQNLYGAGGVDNPDGSRSSLYTMNVQMDDGRSYNIPSVYNGQILPPDRSVVDTRPSAIGNALALGLNNFPSYPSGFAAENRYQQMHNYMDRDTGAYFRSRR